MTASLIGATIEWYDFFLYGVVAGIVFNTLYFPVSDPLVSTLLAYATFAIGYLTQTLKVPRTEALLGVTAAAIVTGATIPFFGWLSDRIGRTQVYAWGAVISGFAAFPAFWVFISYPDSIRAIWFAIIIPFGILYAAVYGPEAALFSELFLARVRYAGISFVYQFSGIFASGLAPIIATALLQYSGPKNPWLVCGYCALSGLISAASAIWIGRIHHRRLMQEAPGRPAGYPQVA